MTNAFLTDRPQPLIIAHRGASAHAPENTLAAFERAVELGADAVELDVMLSRDGQIVVIHDDTVDRTTDGHGRVADLSYEALRQLDAGGKFGAQFAGERIPLLSQVFEAVGRRVLINIELKGVQIFGSGLEQAVIELVRRHDLMERVILSSFNPITLIKVKAGEPRLACGLLYSPDEPFFLSHAWLAPLIPGLNARHPRYDLVTPEMVKTSHARRQCVNVWTVNEAASARQLAATGVDGLIGNDPKLLREALAAGPKESAS